MDRRWTLVIVTILMMLLIYSFLSMVLKKDRKKAVHTRMYRDYSSYNQKKSLTDYADKDSNKKNYSQSNRIAEIKDKYLTIIMNNSSNGYSSFMDKLSKKSEKRKESNNPQYDNMVKLANKPLPELQVAGILFRKGEYEDAIKKLEEALGKLDQLEIKNRMQIYSIMAECYLKLKDDENYIDSKVKQVRIQRKYNKIMKDTFPNFPNNDFMSTQDASSNLLRVKSSTARLPDSPMVREMIKKAELDLQVARKVSQ